MSQAIIIDDSRTMRRILGRILGKLGYAYAEAADGQQALDVLADRRDIDLALVDWNMPVMNGIEFIRSARARHADRDLKIVMVTTENDMEAVMTAIEAGADEFVMKPFTPDVLLEKLDLIGASPAAA